MPEVEHIRWHGDALELLDQRHLPRRTEWVRCTDAVECAAAITDMVIRGAPAIGITAAYGLALEARLGGDLEAAHRVLGASRPTAVNLRWALERMATVPASELSAEAERIHAEDIEVCRAIGRHGAAAVPEGAIYTHCNAGSLATGGYGTALGVIRAAWTQGTLRHVFAGETRPYLQGARLTAWEMQVEEIPCTLICDSVAASLMADGKVDAIVVGCDRVAANGDTANKIGTLSLAVLAKHYGVPLYIAMPMSTLDLRCPNGAAIPIEQRSPEEVYGHAGVRWAADVPVHNPSFDVTPAALIAGWITERGPWRPD